MAGATDSFEADIINYFFRNQAVSQPAAIYMGLSSTVPNEDGTNFTELVGDGYARVAVSLAAPTNGTSATSGAVTFGPASANWSTVVAVGIFFASSGGDLKLFKSVSAKSVTSGTSLTWAAGDLVFTVD